MTSQNPTTVPSGSPAPRSNTLRTVLLVLGSIVLVMILAFTVIGIVRSQNRHDTSGTFSVSESFETVEVKTSAADVDIVMDPRADVPELRYDQGDTNLQFDYSVRDDTLVVSIGNDGWFGWFGGGVFGDWSAESAKLTLLLPETEGRLDVNLETTAGDVRVDGDYADVSVRSTAGDITLSGSVNDLRLESTAGTAELDDLAVRGAFRSETTAGDMDFAFAELPSSIDVESTAGNVRIGLPDGRYRIDANSTAGDISSDVSSDAKADRVYRISTTAGDIEVYER
ncbi:putative adhesin [Homoserinimonas aerilata]|uniref:Putative adhesin n=1 Tax=Homoserinimonas aerilata TaxID=1162970 RepID=A0A542YH25_9MICO|nr:DUF4097 family beta strand repeat-containing protein [Homoserinimonas aerilata]TQL47356.1 putative adhesin [Homoserinimonas aerilata]